MPPKVKRTKMRETINVNPLESLYFIYLFCNSISYFKAKSRTRVAGNIPGANAGGGVSHEANNSREWNIQTADKPETLPEPNFLDNLKDLKRRKIRFFPKKKQKAQAITNLFQATIGKDYVDYDWKAQHKRLLPNDKRKPVVSECNTTHEYEMDLTISGAIFKFYYRMLDMAKGFKTNKNAVKI